MRLIPLKNNLRLIVDDEDFERVNQQKWVCGTNGYVVTSVRGNNRKKIYIHRFIVNCPKKKVVDHINHNPLDNRKINLRICTNQENLWGRKINKNKRSLYKGTVFRPRTIKGLYQISKHRKNWQAHIFYKGKNIYGGVYNTEEEAALAYNKMAIKYFKQYANLNKVQPSV